jgi:hypothetical protein
MVDDGGRRGRFKIRGCYYPTYTSVRAECKKRLEKYVSKAPEDLNHDDFEWFICLIKEMHPYAAEKLHRPVVCIRRYNRYGVNGNNLLLIYDDGSSSPFSWNKCCKGKTASDMVSIRQAMRAAVADQTVAVMNEAFRSRDVISCPMTGETIRRHEAHVDHGPPHRFADITRMFLAKHGLTPDAIPLADDPQGGAVLAPGEIADSWSEFHKEHSRLRVVSAKWNTSAEGRA